MEVLFAGKKLRKECSDWKLLQKRHGPRRAKLIRRRLDELRACSSLEVMRTLPQARCHELRGDRAGQLSVDLDHPYRLLLEPAQNPTPQKPDGGLDWSGVTAVQILGVEDTHG